MTATTTEYTVHGMTCDHCTRAVHDEVAAVDGVEAVTVELQSGRLSVTGHGVDDAAVRAAVDEAGYEVSP